MCRWMGTFADAQGDIDWSDPCEELHRTGMTSSGRPLWRSTGGGTPFFQTLPSWISLRLLENRTFPGGPVLLRYEAKYD